MGQKKIILPGVLEAADTEIAALIQAIVMQKSVIMSPEFKSILLVIFRSCLDSDDEIVMQYLPAKKRKIGQQLMSDCLA